MVIAATRTDAITTAMPAATVKTTATSMASSTMATATITRQASCRKQNSEH
jgi:hypothetical protein